MVGKYVKLTPKGFKDQYSLEIIILDTPWPQLPVLWSCV